MLKSIWNQNATLIWSKFAYHLIKKQNGIDFADFEYLSFQIKISISIDEINMNPRCNFN